MTQSRTLSQESVNIIRQFVNVRRKKSILSTYPFKELMVSIYAKSPNISNKALTFLSKYQIDLESFITEENIATLQAEYAEVIRYCYENDGKDGILTHNPGNSMKLPSTLLELCMAIANCKPGSKVYLPFAGEGQFAYYNTDCSFEGFELSPESWAISQILLSSQNITADITLGDGRVIEDEPSTMQKKYDYIFAFPPFLNGKEGKSVIKTLFYLADQALDVNGEMCCILPMSFCYDSFGFGELRRLLFDKGAQYDAFVISLPSLFWPIATVKPCLLHLSKDGKGRVMLMDASDKSFSASREEADYNDTLKVKSIIETIEKQDEQFVWIGNTQDLTGDYNLTPSRYLISNYLPKPKAGEKLVPIKDLIDFVPFVKKGKAENEAPLLGIKELSFNYLNCEITKDSVPTKPNVGSARLAQDCLLAGFIGNKFKVGRITGLCEENSVSLRPEVFAFTLKNKDITEDFLLRSILSESCTTQAIALSSGVVISRLRAGDFENIQIIVPSLEEQERLCKKDTRVSLSEAERKRLDSADEYRKDIHMKKHTIGQTLFNLNNWWKVLQKARKEGNGVVVDSAFVGINNKIPVTAIYENLQQTITKLQQQISKFDSGYGFEVTNFALTEFIEDYISHKQSPLFTFIYDAQSHRASQTLPEVDIDDTTGKWCTTGKTILNEGDPIEYVDFAPDALEIVFDNIVSNACCHGFEGRKNDNLIRIELDSEGDDYMITIANNGKPIHKDISPEDVFTYGRTSQNKNNHFGIGGYEIRKLMREFKGDVELIIDPTDEFCVTYKLTFHETNIVAVL